ncbi:MAG: hypothetical protein H6745_25040 [Deltaproteobacteria bacterium]|nr:hypothetical protein [Deltaproteobacteria bacterium]
METPTIRRRLALIRQRVQTSQPLEPTDARLLLDLVECGLLALAGNVDQHSAPSTAASGS